MSKDNELDLPSLYPELRQDDVESIYRDFSGANDGVKPRVDLLQPACPPSSQNTRSEHTQSQLINPSFMRNISDSTELLLSPFGSPEPLGSTLQPVREQVQESEPRAATRVNEASPTTMEEEDVLVDLGDRPPPSESIAPSLHGNRGNRYASEPEKTAGVTTSEGGDSSQPLQPQQSPPLVFLSAADNPTHTAMSEPDTALSRRNRAYDRTLLGTRGAAAAAASRVNSPVPSSRRTTFAFILPKLPPPPPVVLREASAGPSPAAIPFSPLPPPMPLRTTQTGQRKGGMRSPEGRAKAARVRKLGACIRCKRLKIGVGATSFSPQPVASNAPFLPVLSLLLPLSLFLSLSPPPLPPSLLSLSLSSSSYTLAPKCY